MKKAVWFLMALATLAMADEMTKLSISGMTCPACAKNVKQSLGDVKGVKETTVYLKEGRAEVKSQKGTNPESLCDAIKQAGYGCKVEK